MGLFVANANAQGNGTNHHLAINGFDNIIAGIGAGIGNPDGSGTLNGDEFFANGDQGLDGMGYWFAGEDIRAATAATIFGTFGHRQWGWRADYCLLNAGANTTGLGLVLNRPHIGLYLNMSSNMNCPTCFTNPFCSSAAPSALLPSSQGYPSSCFVLLGVPSAFGPSSLAVLSPDTTLGNASANPVYILAAANNVISDLNDASVGFCWTSQFQWTPSVVAVPDSNVSTAFGTVGAGTEGIWTYYQNSPDRNQYWGVSQDEVNLWNSNTWNLVSFDTDNNGSPDGLTVLTLPANVEYNGTYQARDAETSVGLTPTGAGGVGNRYYSNGAGAGLGNSAAPFPSVFNLNGGIDMGRGAKAIAFSGLGGAMGPSGIGNQNLANNPPNTASLGAVAVTLGFGTFDNGGTDGLADGSGRVTFGSVDLEGANCLPPTFAFPDITKAGIRIPVNGLGFATLPVINQLFNQLFGHTTAPGWPDPDGVPDGLFGYSNVGGWSVALPIGSGQPGACIGSAVNITYGSIPTKPNGKLDFKQANGTASGSREVFLMF